MLFAPLESDNGLQLKSEEFEQFVKRKGIKHITSAPYYPTTNGLVERCVESFKNKMKSETKVKSGGCGRRHFSIGQRVIARNYSGHSKLVLGTVRTQLGPLSYEVEIGPNLIWRRRTDQLKAYNVSVTDPSPVFHPVLSPTIIENHCDQVTKPSEQSEAVLRETGDRSANPIAEYSVSATPRQVEHVPVRRYPTRVRKPPARLDL